MRVCTLGDLAMDVIVRLEGTFRPGDDTPAATHVDAGGQAANVAAWAVVCGAQARLITKRGDGAAAALAAAELERRGVDLVGPVVEHPGAVVVSVSGDGDERSMLTDRGPSAGLRAEELDVRWLEGCDAFHLSGYALLDGPIAEAGAKAAGAAKTQGARISVDLASAAGIETFGAERVLGRLRQLAPDVVFAGDAELAALGDEPAALTLVVKHGARGVTIVEGGTRQEHDARPTAVVDTTGAGDAFAAGYLVGGVEAGLDAAARCLAIAGAMP
jgi:sugar/nucleoside kinase (ribokinase family)